MPSGDEFGLAVKTKSEGETRTEPRLTPSLSNAGFRPPRTPVFPGSPSRSRLLAAHPDPGAQKPQGNLSRLGIGWSHNRYGGVAYVDERRAEAAGPAPPGPRCPACAHAEVPEVVPRVGEAGPRDEQELSVRRWCEGSDRLHIPKLRASPSVEADVPLRPPAHHDFRSQRGFLWSNGEGYQEQSAHPGLTRPVDIQPWLLSFAHLPQSLGIRGCFLEEVKVLWTSRRGGWSPEGGAEGTGVQVGLYKHFRSHWVCAHHPRSLAHPAKVLQRHSKPQ
ncbi:uncharacterized protein LOC123330708 isoform X2 [Bubalus bubalis]|uniref:uncharacterized protein LOC123330708 isoform X2 n=1 Tax=Bubalus bubalis TaxID=89462 RepID=UPI001E1B96DF|nr:uncharacterized protein LOC123330708 isoform X2 [Bubalus bubalis]